MGAPQIIWLCIMGLSLVVNAINHGEHIEINFGYNLLIVLLHIALLGWGGFFG